MKEFEFKKFLTESNNIESKDKAVQSRVSKALRVERDLKVNLDSIVKDDEEMYNLLLAIKEKLNDKKYHNVHQNAVRKYYLFVNSKEFPRINQYKKLM